MKLQRKSSKKLALWFVWLVKAGCLCNYPYPLNLQNWAGNLMRTGSFLGCSVFPASHQIQQSVNSDFFSVLIILLLSVLDRTKEPDRKMKKKINFGERKEPIF